MILRVVLAGLLLLASAAGAQGTAVPLSPLHQAQVSALSAKMRALQAEVQLFQERAQAQQRALEEERRHLTQDLQETYKVHLGTHPGDYDVNPEGTALVKREVPKP